MSQNDNTDAYLDQVFDQMQESGSSPASGAEQEGAPPAPAEAPPQQAQGRHEPPRDSPRWNEIYRQAKEQEREIEELRKALAERDQQALNDAMMGRPATRNTGYAPESDESGDEDILGSVIGEAVQKAVAPVMQAIQQQQQHQQLQQRLTQFRQSHPEYDDQRDAQRMLHWSRQTGVSDPEFLYRMAFPERVAMGGQQQQQAASAPASQQAPPVGHVPTASTTGESAQNVSALMARMNDPATPINEKQRIAAILSTKYDAWGMKSAEDKVFRD